MTMPRGGSAFFGDEIEEIIEFDPLTGKKVATLRQRPRLRQLALCDARPDDEAGGARRSATSWPSG